MKKLIKHLANLVNLVSGKAHLLRLNKLLQEIIANNRELISNCSQSNELKDKQIQNYENLESLYRRMVEDLNLRNGALKKDNEYLNGRIKLLELENQKQG